MSCSSPFEQIVQYSQRQLYSGKSEEPRNFLLSRLGSEYRELVRMFRLGYYPLVWGACPESHHPMLQQRIVIPIIGVTGDVLTLSARAVSGNGQQVPYWNYPGYPRHLYNLYGAWPETLRTGYLIVVEGYFDVYSLYRAGYRNVVASCGSSLTTRQCALIASVTQKVILMPDQDKAGYDGADKSMKKLQRFGVTAYRATTPDYFGDPDNLVTLRGRAGVESLLSPVLEKLAAGAGQGVDDAIRQG